MVYRCYFYCFLKVYHILLLLFSFHNKCLLIYKDNRKSYGQWYVICFFSRTRVLGEFTLGSKVIQLHGSVQYYGATDHPTFWCCTAKIGKRLYPWKDKTFVQKWKKNGNFAEIFQYTYYADTKRLLFTVTDRRQAKWINKERLHLMTLRVQTFVTH